MKKLGHLALSENNFAFDPLTGQSYELNTLGREIIDLIIQGKESNEIVGIVEKKYNLDHKVAWKDVNDFFMKLRIFGLIESL